MAEPACHLADLDPVQSEHPLWFGDHPVPQPIDWARAEFADGVLVSYSELSEPVAVNWCVGKSGCQCVQQWGKMCRVPAICVQCTTLCASINQWFGSLRILQPLYKESNVTNYLFRDV